jgi:hypothetical protein
MERKASIGFEITTESPTGEKQGHLGMHHLGESGSSRDEVGRNLSVVM